jgi:hypothetical protein
VSPLSFMSTKDVSHALRWVMEPLYPETVPWQGSIEFTLRCVRCGQIFYRMGFTGGLSIDELADALYQAKRKHGPGDDDACPGAN